MELILVAGEHQKELALYIFTNGVQESSQGTITKSALKKNLLQSFVAVSLVLFAFYPQMLFCENEILNPLKWEHFADHCYFHIPQDCLGSE